MKTWNRVLWLPVMLTVIIGGWLAAGMLAGEPPPEQEHHVQKKTGSVVKDSKVGQGAEAVAPESVELLEGGKIKVTTKTFKPPKAKEKGKEWKFKDFTTDQTPANRKAFNPGAYVDIESTRNACRRWSMRPQ